MEIYALPYDAEIPMICLDEKPYQLLGEKQRVLAVKIYRTRDNLRFCKKYGIQLSGPALGRPKKDEKPDKLYLFARY